MNARRPIPPPRPNRPPRAYLSESWPHGRVRRLPDDEGGEAIEFSVEQAARLIGQIVARREERGLRRSQLAAMTGLRPNTISDLEEGRTWPDLRTLCLIAWALEADIEFERRVPLRARGPIMRQDG